MNQKCNQGTFWDFVKRQRIYSQKSSIKDVLPDPKYNSGALAPSKTFFDQMHRPWKLKTGNNFKSLRSVFDRKHFCFIIDPFTPNTPCLYPLKTSKTLRFSDVFRE